jgi:NitT/TauT family transport system ATP-binding protein
MDRVPPRIGYMLQKDLLLPWRTALADVVLGLQVKHLPRRERLQRGRELLQRLGLDGCGTGLECRN